MGSSAKWYAGHKEELNRKRRKRYGSDPQYREAVLAANREKQTVEVVKTTPKTRSRYLRPKVVKIGSADTVVWSVGVLADQLGVSDEAVKQWVEAGVIPPATWVDEVGRRWFGARYIDLMRKTPRLHPLSAWTVVLWKAFGLKKEVRSDGS